MKAKVITILGVLILTLILYFTFQTKSFEKQFIKTMQSLDSYVLEGTMEFDKDETTKKYRIAVMYQKQEEKEWFKVSLIDEQLNQQQDIIRNQDGVFVATPSLNQVFQFEGEWPLNTPKPYLLQTLAMFMEEQNPKAVKEDHYHKIEMEVAYPSNEKYRYETVYFDEDGKVKNIQIFDDQRTRMLNLVLDKVEYNTEIDPATFEEPKQLEKPVLAENRVQEEDLPLYPNITQQAQLTKQSVMKVNGKNQHVLEFQGDKNFTIVEEVVQPQESTQLVIMPGTMMEHLDLIGVHQGNKLSAVQDGIAYSIYSNDLDVEEMMEILSSMQVAVMK